MSDIQKARDVLAKWRKGVVVTSIHDLIEGTAGNPDLLDAIDGLLAAEQVESGVCHCGTDLGHHRGEPHNFVDMGYPPDPLVRAIAAAIIAADERMSA